MKIIVSVSDKYNWCLKPFSYLFNRYWGKVRVDIAGYTKPRFSLPNNFFFNSIDNYCYPKNKWAVGMLKYLNTLNDETFVLLLEDYFLTRYVDIQGIKILNKMVLDQKDIIRMDLTTDRQFAGGSHLYGYYNRFDIICSPESPYEMSLQAAIWRRELFMDILNELPDNKKSAWDVELIGNNILIEKGYKVFGTCQCPVKYVNGANNAKGINYELTDMSKHDLKYIKNMIPEG